MPVLVLQVNAHFDQHSCLPRGFFAYTALCAYGYIFNNSMTSAVLLWHGCLSFLFPHFGHFDNWIDKQQNPERYST